MTMYLKAEPYKAKPPVVGMPVEYEARFRRLWKVWYDRLDDNVEKLEYYNCDQPLKDLGIAIPKHMAKRVNSRCDWPVKAVDYLANRSQFDSFVFQGETDWKDVMDGIVRDNNFDTAYDQAVRSELVFSPAFITVSAGKADEPSVLIRTYSAIEAAALYDERMERIDCAFTITSADDSGVPDAYNLYTSDAVVEIWKSGNVWEHNVVKHNHGRPLIEPLTYRADRWSPFGHSRVSKTVRDLTDEARANKVQTSVASELFSVPQRYLLGAEEDIFDGGSKWDAYIGTIFAVTKDADGDIPSYGQLSQATMEPLLSVWRKLAKEFSGATGVPLQSLGVTADNNPTSAEAMHMVENDIIVEAEHLNRSNGRALERVAVLALAISAGVSLPEFVKANPEAATVSAKFANPQRPSMSQRSDFAMKVAAIYPEYAQTSVFKQDMGWDDATRKTLEDEERRIRGSQVIKLLAGREPAEQEAEESA